MTKKDYNFIAEILVNLYQNRDITWDGILEFGKALNLKYKNFDMQTFRDYIIYLNSQELYRSK